MFIEGYGSYFFKCCLQYIIVWKRFTFATEVLMLHIQVKAKRFGGPEERFAVETREFNRSTVYH